MLPLIIVGVIVLLIGVYAVGIYNRLVKLREVAKGSFSQIDVQLERRHDLIPNLVETARGFMAHEAGTLEAVIAARASATQTRIEVNGDPSNIDAMQKLGASESNLGGALGRLLATAEAYPEIKADRQMTQLTEELRSTENKISFARQNFNTQVLRYQEYKQTFPPVIFASLFGFEDDAYLDLETEGNEDKREAVEVNFDGPQAAA